MKYITFFFLLIAQLSFAQSKSLTKVINRIDYQEDTIRAVFDWVTDNIKYDVGKLKELKKGVNFYKKGKYKSTKEYKAALLEIVIKKKKGVCQDYSLLFDNIVRELGYTSFIVAGITKGPKGRISKSIGHAWNAVKVNGSWKLYDPTWGAGYVNGKRKFVKKYFEQWYNVDPEEMKEKHLPFDPIWQLSEKPMTFSEFKKGVQSENSDTLYGYSNMIEAYLNKEEKEKMIAELERLKLNGGNIKPITKRKKYLQKKIDNYGVSSNNDLIKATVDNCRKSSERFGEYVKEAKNKRFKGKKWTLEYSQTALLEIKDQVNESIATFKNIEVNSSKSKRAFKKYISQSKSLLGYLDKELKFLERKL